MRGQLQTAVDWIEDDQVEEGGGIDWFLTPGNGLLSSAVTREGWPD